MTSVVIAQRVLRPSRTMALVLVVTAAALTALSAQWRVHLPFTPVPITGQTLVVLLTGAALGWRLGAAGQVLYLAAGIAGAPVFSDGRSGWATIVGTTGGYLLGFLAAAALVGWMAERGHDRQFLTMVGAFAAGTVVIYLFGMAGLMAATGWGHSEAFVRGVAPFLVGDLVKAVTAGLLLPGAWRILGKRD
jgi:biotin transport system substrate-specific component